jgi:hypothetical protein
MRSLTAQLQRILAIAMVCGTLGVSLALPFFDFSTIQTGREFPVHIHALYSWQQLKQCGFCMLWNNHGGGSPFYGDPYTAAQHPVVAVATVLTNPRVAANITIIYAIALMAVSGLWYAHLYGLRTLPTVWLTCMLMAGGHLLTRIEVGSIALPLAVASWTSAVVAVIAWTRQPSMQRIFLMSLAIAGLALAGQGYFQLLFAFCCFPLLWDALMRIGNRLVARAVLSVGGMVLLLTLPVVVSYLLYGHLMQKEGDLDATAPPQLAEFFLHLIWTADTSAHQELLYPYLYRNTVGPVTVLLAGVGVWSLVRRQSTHDGPVTPAPSIVWLWILVLTAVLFSGALQWGLRATGIAVLVTWASYIRNVLVVGSAFAVVVIVLSAHGYAAIEATYRVHAGGQRLRSVGVFLLLAWQVWMVRSTVMQYVSLTPYQSDSSGVMAALADDQVSYLNVQTDMQYLDVLESPHKNFWNLFYPYHPRDKPAIEPRLLLSTEEADPSMGWEPQNISAEWTLYARQHATAQYVQLADSAQLARDACTVNATAGTIDLACTVRTATDVTIQEYAFPDWEVTVDNRVAPLVPGPFLRVSIPEGTHRVAFHYRPWYVICAAVLSIVGWVVSMARVLLLLQRSRNARKH